MQWALWTHGICFCIEDDPTLMAFPGTRGPLPKVIYWQDKNICLLLCSVCLMTGTSYWLIKLRVGWYPFFLLRRGKWLPEIFLYLSVDLKHEKFLSGNGHAENLCSGVCLFLSGPVDTRLKFSYFKDSCQAWTFWCLDDVWFSQDFPLATQALNSHCGVTLPFCRTISTVVVLFFSEISGFH